MLVKTGVRHDESSDDRTGSQPQESEAVHGQHHVPSDEAGQAASVEVDTNSRDASGVEHVVSEDRYISCKHTLQPVPFAVHNSS